MLITSAVLVAALATGGGLFAKHQHDVNVREDHEAAAAAEAEQQAEQEAEEAQSAQEQADDLERAARLASVEQLESNIKKHAKKQVNSGVLTGPILESSCTALGGGSTDDLTALTATFDCIAVNKRNKDGTSSGYSYTGTIDWESGELTWQLGG